jgi:hypothetical protein
MSGLQSTGNSTFRRTLEHVLLLSEIDIPGRILAMKSELLEQEWSNRLNDSIFHISVEVLLGEFERSSFILHRMLGLVEPGALDTGAMISALACLVRCTSPSYPGIMDRFLHPSSIDPYTDIDGWCCRCSSNCSLAYKMCIGNSLMGLALHSGNTTAVERLLSLRPPPKDFSLFSLAFKKTRSLSPDQVNETHILVSNVFAEEEAFISACRLLAVLEDARANFIDAIPIEQVGLWGRSARHLLPSLKSSDGSCLLSMISGIRASVSGRDVVFRFLLDMKVSPSSPKILENALRNNPSFWTPQSTGSSPPLMLGIDADLSPSFLRMFCHIDTCMCTCGICRKWREEGSLNELRSFMQMRAGPKLDGYYLMCELGQFAINKMVCLGYIERGADLTVTDNLGNTVCHLASDIEILELLAKKGADFNTVNSKGSSPLESAIFRGDMHKIQFLISFCRCTLSVKSLSRIFAIVDSNAELFKLMQSSLSAVGTLEPNAGLEIHKLRQRLSLEKQSSKKRLKEMEIEHMQAIDDLKRAQLQEITEISNSFGEEVKNIHDSMQSKLLAIAELEEKANQLTLEKSTLERERDELKERSMKIERIRSKEIAKREVERRVIETERETRECPLCMESLWDTALLCGHCYCSHCIKAACTESCPTCAKKTSGKFIRLFNCRR